MDKEELLRMVSELGGDILNQDENDPDAGYVDMSILQLGKLKDAILERAATVAEFEPKVWDFDAPSPQQRISAKIRAMKG